MKKLTFTALMLSALSCFSVHTTRALAQGPVPYADCGDLAKRLPADVQAGAQTLQEAVQSFQDIAKHVTCFASVIPSISRPTGLDALAESFSDSMQQSSPSGTSGSTSTVSKPAGGTTLIQDVGGVTATNNGSALTLQVAPGDLIQQFAKAGVFDFCTAAIQTKGCKSTTWLKVFAPATFSVTANTTTPGTTATGTAASAGSVVPATLKSLSNTLTFGGVTAKYGFLYKKPTSDGTATKQDPLPAAAGSEAKALGSMVNQLKGCSAYATWTSDPDVNRTTTTALSQSDTTALTTFLVSSYTDLFARLSADSSCSGLLPAVVSALKTVSAFQAAVAAQHVLATSSTPMLGLEYDFTTPASKPSYHSAKLNFSWQSTVSCKNQVQAAQTKALKNGLPMTALMSPTSATCPGKDGLMAPSTTPASATPSWTVSASGGADIYADEPTSTITSASRLRDIQAGAEITRVWKLSAHNPQDAALSALLSKVGDVSLIGAYYYQDQTSPSILNGPPATITFNGLPTTATQVFATRGPINVGQLRLGFGTGTNLRFPVAVSYSNRSDLITHPFVGVQFGVSYDLFSK